MEEQQAKQAAWSRRLVRGPKTCDKNFPPHADAHVEKLNYSALREIVLAFSRILMQRLTTLRTLKVKLVDAR